MRISGPISLNVYNDDCNYYYIFGDLHGDMKHLCIDHENVVWDLIHDMINNNPNNFFNIFIEIGNRGTTYDEKIDIIYKLFETFKHRVSVLDRRPRGNSMVHYVDYRVMDFSGIPENKYTLSHNFFRNIEMLDYNYTLLFDKKQIKYKLLDNIITLLYDFIVNERVENPISFSKVLQFYITNSKITKQLSKIKNPLYVKIINEYIKRSIEHVALIYKDTVDYKEALNIALKYKTTGHKKTFTERDRNVLMEVYKCNFQFQIIIMDAYTMGRLLREFVEFKNPKYANNKKINVLYVGNNHAITYGILLEKMGFKRTFSSKTDKKNKRCITIDDRAFSFLKLSNMGKTGSGHITIPP